MRAPAGTPDRSTLPPGTLVKHTARFLRSVGWYTNVPVNGLVVEPEEDGLGLDFVYVQWCDRETVAPIRTCNVIEVSRLDHTTGE